MKNAEINEMYSGGIEHLTIDCQCNQIKIIMTVIMSRNCPRKGPRRSVVFDVSVCLLSLLRGKVKSVACNCIATDFTSNEMQITEIIQLKLMLIVYFERKTMT